MPRDVSTRWNSTYTMLTFAVEYQEAIITITSDIKYDLTGNQLTREEWKYACELSRALKVRYSLCLVIYTD